MQPLKRKNQEEEKRVSVDTNKYKRSRYVPNKKPIGLSA